MSTIEFSQIRNAIQTLETTGEAWRNNFWAQAAIMHQAELPSPIAKKLLTQQLNHSEMQLLSQIVAAPAAEVAYQDLVKELPFSQGLLSRYVKKLEQAGLLNRFHQASNKKAVYLSITSTGQLIAELHQAMHQEQDKHYAKLLSQFSNEDLTKTITVLQALGTTDN